MAPWWATGPGDWVRGDAGRAARGLGVLGQHAKGVGVGDGKMSSHAPRHWDFPLGCSVRPRSSAQGTFLGNVWILEMEPAVPRTSPAPTNTPSPGPTMSVSFPKPVLEAHRSQSLALFIGSGLSLGRDIRATSPRGAASPPVARCLCAPWLARRAGHPSPAWPVHRAHAARGHARGTSAPCALPSIATTRRPSTTSSVPADAARVSASGRGPARCPRHPDHEL